MANESGNILASPEGSSYFSSTSTVVPDTGQRSVYFLCFLQDYWEGLGPGLGVLYCTILYCSSVVMVAVQSGAMCNQTKQGYRTNYFSGLVGCQVFFALLLGSGF